MAEKVDAMAILSGGAAEEGTRIKGAAEAEAQFEAKPLTAEERAALAKAAAAREAKQASIDAKENNKKDAAAADVVKAAIAKGEIKVL